MKKFFAFLTIAIATICLCSCGGGEDSKLIRIQFVPSQDASIISAQSSVLKERLEAEMPGYTFEITTGTDYTAVVNAMEAGQIEVGFLTAQQYAQASIEMPGKVEPILTSIRSAYQVQIDYPNDFAAQINAMNGGVAGYDYKGQQAKESVTYYNSICITKKESSINVLADLAGKKVGVQKTSSGAGYVYPAVALYGANMGFVTTTPNAAQGEVQAVQQASYPAAIASVLSGDVDAAWIFLDARYTAYENNESAGAEYYQTGKIFAETKVVAMTTGIYNDTVSVVSSLSADVKTKLQNAFIAISQDKVNGGADALYKIYSHTGYKKAVDADYAGEREVYNFKKNNLK